MAKKKKVSVAEQRRRNAAAEKANTFNVKTAGLRGRFSPVKASHLSRIDESIPLKQSQLPLREVEMVPMKRDCGLDGYRRDMYLFSELHLAARGPKSDATRALMLGHILNAPAVTRFTTGSSNPGSNSRPIKMMQDIMRSGSIAKALHESTEPPGWQTQFYADVKNGTVQKTADDWANDIRTLDSLPGGTIDLSDIRPSGEKIGKL